MSRFKISTLHKILFKESKKMIGYEGYVACMGKLNMHSLNGKTTGKTQV
jgi:hypothetical protein